MLWDSREERLFLAKWTYKGIIEDVIFDLNAEEVIEFTKFWWEKLEKEHSY